MWTYIYKDIYKVFFSIFFRFEKYTNKINRIKRIKVVFYNFVHIRIYELLDTRPGNSINSLFIILDVF